MKTFFSTFILYLIITIYPTPMNPSILNINFTVPLLISYSDQAFAKQITFQDPASLGMAEIIDLHHFIFFFLLAIVNIIGYFLFIIIYSKVTSALQNDRTDRFFVELDILEAL